VHNDERLALIGVCQFMNRTLATARLYADTFSTDSSQAEDLRAGLRSRAARAAVLAGCGVGSDAATLSASDRIAWRRQALEWLQADLITCTKYLDADFTANRDLVRGILGNWKSDSDLSGLREQSAIERMSTVDKNACLELWQDVEIVLKRTREVK
jgi:hypothetical protein